MLYQDDVISYEFNPEHEFKLKIKNPALIKISYEAKIDSLASELESLRRQNKELEENNLTIQK